MQRLETTQGPTHLAVSQIEVLWRPFFVISSLFSLLASLAAARPGKVQTLMQYSCSSVVHYFFKGFHASLLLFPRVSQSPTLISTISLFCDRTISLLSSLFFFLSSLADVLFSDPSSRLSLRSVHEAIDCASNCFVLSLRSVHQAIDGAPHCFVPWRHSHPHPDVVFLSQCLRFYLCAIP